MYRNIVKIGMLILYLLTSYGCMATLGPVEDLAGDSITIIDNRPAEDKVGHTIAFGTPVYHLGDDNFDVNPQSYLKNALYQIKPADVETVNLEISKFSLIDFFPQRQRASMSGALTGVLGSWGISYYGASSAEGIDSIICTLEAKINSTEVKVSSQVPYKISMFSGSVRAQPEWIQALKDSIVNCANAAGQIANWVSPVGQLDEKPAIE